MAKSSQKQNNQVEQIDRFQDAARELGCDESPERFNETLGKIARHKPPSDPPKKLKPAKDKPAK